MEALSVQTLSFLKTLVETSRQQEPKKVGSLCDALSQLGIEPVDPVAVDQYKADMVKGKFVGFFEFHIHHFFITAILFMALLSFVTMVSLSSGVGASLTLFSLSLLLLCWVFSQSGRVEYGVGAWTQETLNIDQILVRDEAFDLAVPVVNRIRRIHEVYPHFSVWLERFGWDPILRLVDTRTIPIVDTPDSFVIAMWDCPGFNPEKHRVSVSGV
ncbi:hypothetical protein COB55_05780 [Candidatus Wolfebacteria bacterium]|nr:MAG: hypothetical protein COB55_05780 [Candidatus Wolfebacteria bacterium]